MPAFHDCCYGQPMPVIDDTAVSHARPGAAVQVLAAVAGAAVFAFLLGQAGSLTHLAEQGAMAGIAVGAVAGWGVSKGYIRPFVGRMLLFAVAGAFMGAGCDADPLFSSLFGIVFGLTMTWQGAVVLATAILGAVVTNSIFGLLAGILGWWLMYRAPTQIRKCFTRRPLIDRPSYASLRGDK